ncbi:hypothetical protein GCM10023333_16870 [Ferrimonas pelagia]|uniref:Uncharacterized protein n=1 Tax=Ferrimonas pelagia TaxID=1177826 RepID=A0ABP9ENS2_9GAMM
MGQTDQIDNGIGIRPKGYGVAAQLVISLSEPRPVTPGARVLALEIAGSEAIYFDILSRKTQSSGWFFSYVLKLRKAAEWQLS